MAGRALSGQARAVIARPGGRPLSTSHETVAGGGRAETSISGRSGLDDCLDHSRIGGFQILVYALCALMAMVDGYDTQAIGMVAPAIATAWHVGPAAFSGVFGSALFTAFLGALAMGGASDRFGRKKVLVGSILLFACASLATPFTHNVQTLAVVRLIAGFGLGGALPNLVATTSELAPRAVRTKVAALMFCSFPLGSVLAGVIAAQIIPRWGWGSVFLVDSLFALALLPVFVAVVPEAVRFLAEKGDMAGVAKVLAQVRAETTWDGQLAKLEGPPRSSVAGLFISGRALGTVLLWIGMFFSLLLSVFVVSWLPLVARSAGIDAKSAVLAISAWNIGGILGAYLISLFAGRVGLVPTMAVSYAVGAVGVFGLGLSGHSGSALLGAAFGAGVFMVGAQMSMVGLAAGFYDTSRRATGVGWFLGWGKFGAVVGPTIGGLMIASGMTMPVLFGIASLVSLATAVIVVAFGPASRRVSTGDEAIVGSGASLLAEEPGQ
jgi:AAHS family 4-hydroxybenzoate transporter-like MFS transporter